MKANPSILDTARRLAVEAHAGQTRRDGMTPYISHPLAVAKRVALRGGSEEAQAVALLHDSQEADAANPVSDELMRSNGLPEVVIEAVGILTQKDRWKSYKRHIQEIASSSNPLVKQVKIADILTNLADDPTDRQLKKYATAVLVFLD